jgi:hypothetical protein
MIRPVSEARSFAKDAYGNATIEANSPDDIPDVVEAAQISANPTIAKTT